MPFDPNEFDLEEDGQGDSLTVDDDEELSEPIQQALIDSLTGTGKLQKEEEIDVAYLQDVDKRLEVAHYYRMLTKNQLFEERNEATVIVEREIGVFVRERLTVLLNLQGAVAVKKEPAVFTDDEVKILKIMAATLAKKPAVLDGLNQNQATRKTSPVRRQGVKVVASTRPTPAIVPAPPPPQPVSKPAPAPEVTSGRRLRRAKFKEHLTEEGKKVKLNVTPQVRSSRSIPMPADMAAATALVAQAQAQAISNTDGGLGAAISSNTVTITSSGERNED